MVPRLILAFILATSPAKADQQKIGPKQKQQTVQQEHSGKLNLALKFGYSMHARIPYQERRASLTIDEYLIEIQFRKENSERDLGQETNYFINGISFTGERASRNFQSNVIFGYAFYENERRFLNTRFYGQVMGGIQLTKNTLKVEQEKIPTDPNLDFLLGTGARLELSHPINSWTKLFLLRNLEIGLGAFVEYLSSQLEIPESDSRLYYGGYLSLGLSKKR